MKTQISREGYRWQQRYSGVYQQQGRMITDSDWNELVDILKARVDETLVDVVGRGMPKGRAVQIQMAAGVPRFVPGHVYAAGVEGAVDPIAGAALPFGFNQQKDFPSAPPLPPTNSNIAYRLYADVWDRTVTSLEDEALRDPALHGADTCARTQRMAQIKTCAANLDPQFFPVTGDSLLTLRYPQGGGPSGPDPCDSQADLVDPVGGDFLFRLEVHDVRWPNATAAPNEPNRVVLKWSRENGAEQYPFHELPDWFTTGQWTYELFDAESEKHLGYHRPALANSQTWAPEVGALVTALPQTAPPNTGVRRWEGYCVLLRSTAGIWSTSPTQGETEEETALGAEIDFGSVQQGENTLPTTEISLPDLEIMLEVGAKVFLPGDYWTVPVRRATYVAGEPLVEEAFPSGVIHRYVTLGTVQANATLQAPTAAEQRRLAFPRLTEIDAEDIGYGTTCNSGLFTSAHDTVEKALDRLCSINATHVGFTKTCDTSVFQGSNPTTVAQALALLCSVTANQIGYSTTCGSGLFDASHNTVTKALDRLCSIGAQHIGFTKPANTSIYEGVNPITVAQALNLLADVRSEQIHYVPSQNPLGVNDVKGALDELYGRPVGNGARVYVGQNGQYASIDLAINDLVAQGKDIAIALMPGDHVIPSGYSPPAGLNGANLNILGLGENARLTCNSVLVFLNLASFTLENLVAEFPNTHLALTNCRRVVIRGCRLGGSRTQTNPANNPLVTISGADSAMIQSNFIDTTWRVQDQNLLNTLSNALVNVVNVQNLFGSSLQAYRDMLTPVVSQIVTLPAATRTAIRNAIMATNPQNLTNEENVAYTNLANAINAGIPTAAVLTQMFDAVRTMVLRRDPATAVSFVDAVAVTTVEDNRIVGYLGLHGTPHPSNNLDFSEGSLVLAGQQGRINISSTEATLKVSNNWVTGIRLGSNTVSNIRNSATGGGFVNLTTYRHAVYSGNTIDKESNHFAGTRLSLDSNTFTRIGNQALVDRTGWAVGAGATIVGNIASTPNSQFFSGMQFGLTAHAANLAIAVQA